MTINLLSNRSQNFSANVAYLRKLRITDVCAFLSEKLFARAIRQAK